MHCFSRGLLISNPRPCIHHLGRQAPDSKRVLQTLAMASSGKPEEKDSLHTTECCFILYHVLLMTCLRLDILCSCIGLVSERPESS